MSPIIRHAGIRSLLPIKGVISTVLLMCAVHAYSQSGLLVGQVTDRSNGEALPGVNILIDSIYGISSDSDGRFSYTLSAGIHHLEFRYIGFENLARTIQTVSDQTLELQVALTPSYIDLDAAVVTAGRFRQRLSDVSVSMEVIRPRFIETTNTVNMETAIGQLAGVDVLDGQASIRGGSGYSFGAGSRIQLLVDDLPMLTADVNEVKWNFIPVENVGHVEVLKGASSALYGSSALNGVINILTDWPGDQPETKVNLFGGYYMKPKREEMAWWWDGPPVFGGASLSTAQKFGNLDLVFGANIFQDDGYRQDNYEKRMRTNIKLRYRSQKIDGLSYGVNSNIQWQNTSDFLIWQDADSGAFLQRTDAITPTKGLRFNVDPWITFFDSKNNRHSLKTRYYSVYNRFTTDPDKDNGSDLYFGEYQYQREFFDKMNVTAGFMGFYGETDARLYGNHTNSNLALYLQLEYKISSRLNASAGFRMERYTLDESDRENSQVMRAGINYQLATATFLRASGGQGYRFPSIAEKYTATTVGSLNVFPNPDLQSETGWSSEIGIKQGFQLGNWKGYLDVAGYWTEYQDMIEFTFGVWVEDTTQVPGLDDLGFKSLNVGEARINGIDINLNGAGKVWQAPLVFFVGYTYMNPVDLSSDTLENNTLKYRYRHSFKGDVEIRPGKFYTGLSFRYNSFMERIDEAFEERILGQEIFPGLKDYRQQNNSGSWILDFRFGYQLNSMTTVSMILKNMLNEEAMGRPGDIRAPRNATLMVMMKF